MPSKRLSFDPQKFLATIGRGVTLADYRQDQVVFAQGDPAVSVFYIQSGKVKGSVLSEQGKGAVLAILKAGQFVGEGCLSRQTKRLATVTAITRCTIARIEKATMLRVLHDEPAFAEKFLAHLLSRIVRVEDDLADHRFNSTEKRLARVLLLLANFAKDRRPEPIDEKIDQGTLAEMIGATRASVSVFMNKFRKLGLIDYRNGHIEVRRSLQNVVLH